MCRTTAPPTSAAFFATAAARSSTCTLTTMIVSNRCRVAGGTSLVSSTSRPSPTRLVSSVSTRLHAFTQHSDLLPSPSPPPFLSPLPPGGGTVFPLLDQGTYRSAPTTGSLLIFRNFNPANAHRFDSRCQHFAETTTRG